MFMVLDQYPLTDIRLSIVEALEMMYGDGCVTENLLGFGITAASNAASSLVRSEAGLWK